MQYELSREEWMILEYVQKILAAFFEATNMISGNKYVTIGLGFLAIANIKDFLEERSGINEIDRLKHLLLKELQRYFENDYEQWELIKVSDVFILRFIVLYVQYAKMLIEVWRKRTYTFTYH